MVRTPTPTPNQRPARPARISFGRTAAAPTIQRYVSNAGRAGEGSARLRNYVKQLLGPILGSAGASTATSHSLHLHLVAVTGHPSYPLGLVSIPLRRDLPARAAALVGPQARPRPTHHPLQRRPGRPDQPFDDLRGQQGQPQQAADLDPRLGCFTGRIPKAGPCWASRFDPTPRTALPRSRRVPVPGYGTPSCRRLTTSYTVSDPTGMDGNGSQTSTLLEPLYPTSRGCPTSLERHGGSATG